MILRCNESELAPRDHALEAAILFRDCAARVRTSKPTRVVCRRLMRERALLWRQLAPPGNGCAKPA